MGFAWKTNDFLSERDKKEMHLKTPEIFDENKEIKENTQFNK